MTILDDLEADHRELKAEIRAILKFDDRKGRVARFSHFRILLTAHSRAEENVLYRGLEKSEKGKDEALEGTVEHEVADRLAEDLSASRRVGSCTAWSCSAPSFCSLIGCQRDEL